MNNSDINQSGMTVSSQPLVMTLMQAAINEARNNIQAPQELIEMAVLAAISVVSQGLIDVCKPGGQVVPTSLMLLTIADSGERKSTVEKVFMKPVRDFQQQHNLMYQCQVQKWQVKYDIWVARRKAMLKGINKKTELEQPTQDEEQQLSAHQETQPVLPKEGLKYPPIFDALTT